MTNTNKPAIIVGTLICRRTSFLLDKFLTNQRQIQESYPACSLTLATDEADFASELKERIRQHHVKGEVLLYKTVKPAQARSRVWNIACGREALRQYTLSNKADYILLADGDMTYEPDVVHILRDKIRGYDVLWSGYRFPPRGELRFAGGCLLINTKILNRVKFRCYEFRSGDIIFEDELFDIDSFKQHARINKGIYVSIKHYQDVEAYINTSPQRVTLFRKLANLPLVRYILINMSVRLGYNIPGVLHRLLYRTTGSDVKLTT